MGIPLAAGLALGGGLLGALAGGQGSKQSQTTQRTVAPESQLEKQAGGLVGDQLSALQGLVNVGPGQQDVDAGLSAQRSLAALLQQLTQTSGLPSQQDFAQAQQFTNQAFAPQQLAMSQAFSDEDLELQKLAARTGRSPMDPVLQNKLAQTRGRLMQDLGAQQTQFLSNFAQQLPQQRLNLQSQFAGVQSQLASQALSNRQALLQLGQSIKGGEQNFRLGTASTTTTGTSGGGLSGMISGGLAGVGTGLGMAGPLSTLLKPTTTPQQVTGAQAFAGYNVA